MKKAWQKFSEFRKTPKGKAILFFGFYALFFVFIYFYAHMGKTYRSMEGYEKGTPYRFQIESLLNENYQYTYTITLDGEKYIYTGKKADGLESFIYNNQEYYGDHEEYYVLKETWEKTENPYLFPSLLKMDSVFSLLEVASYDSKTSYESGKTNYNFLISTNTINQMIHEVESDFEEEPNMIIISSNAESVVNQISWNLDSYCILNGLCERSLKIDMKFDDYGDVQVDNPLQEVDSHE